MATGTRLAGLAHIIRGADALHKRFPYLAVAFGLTRAEMVPHGSLFPVEVRILWPWLGT